MRVRITPSASTAEKSSVEGDAASDKTLPCRSETPQPTEMNIRSVHSLKTFVVAAALASQVMPTTLAASFRFPAPADLPSQTGLPDPLVTLDGRRVSTPREWGGRRRELKALFQHFMYGSLPPKPIRVTPRVTGEHLEFLGGKATLTFVTLSFGTDSPELDLMLVTPRAATGRVPVFLALNFCGNHAVHADSRIPLTRGWLYPSCAGCKDGHATEAARGSQAQDWPLESIIDRGYAFATVCTTDIDSDRKDVSDGVYRWLAMMNQTSNPPADRGTIAAWAWGLHRCVDYLVTNPLLDPKRIAVVGHSRNGKTALLAGAMDERIALAIPCQAGCGGTAPSRGTVGESVQRINTAFPHWFNANYKQFNEDPTRLPFDQNALVALMAPRPVLLSNATEDTWANPAGQFEVLRGAESVYRLLGAGGCDAATMPPPGELVKSRLGYYIRPGKHSMTAGDWAVFLDYADVHLSGRK